MNTCIKNYLVLTAASSGPVSASVLLLTAIVVAIPILVVVTYLRLDYRRHKKPLQEVDPNVRYTFWHHIRVVTVPLFSYRITFYVSKKKDR